MKTIWTRVLIGLALLVLGTAHDARAQTVGVSVEVDSQVYQVGEGISGRVLLDVRGRRPGMTATTYLMCSDRGDAPISIAEEAASVTPDERRQILRTVHLGLLRGRLLAMRTFVRPIERDGRLVIPIGADEGVRLVDHRSGWLAAPGNRQVVALVVLEADELYELAIGSVGVTVKTQVPKLTVTAAKVDPSTPVQPLSPFTIVVSYEMEGMPSDPGATVKVRRQASVKERKPLRERPYQNSRADTVEVPGSADGKGRFEKRWRATLPRSGTYDFEFELTCPGYRNAVKKLVVTVPTTKASAQQGAPSQAGKPATEWVLQHTIGDPDRLEGRALLGGTISGVSASGFTVNYDQVNKISNGYAPNSLLKVSVAGSPPAKLRKGDRFQMTISATASKLGMDKCADGREPSEQASANLKASSHIKITATPHASGIVFPDGHDGTATCVGGYFGKWWSSDSRTYTLEVTDADAGGELTILAYFPGFGQFARYVYARPKGPSPGGPGTVGATGPKPVPQLASDEEFPPLNVVLEPSEIEVSPRSGISTLATLRIKGDRPNWKPVEVLIDTVDAWGALRMCRYLKIEGKGSRETGDMWKTNDGTFHWNLNVLANLGVPGGTFVVPITVRQVGHGQVVRWLTIRVPADAQRPAPSVARSSEPGPLATTFEAATLTLRPGGIAVRNRLYVGGFAEGAEPVVVTFPGAAFGALPGGLRVMPGELTSDVAEATKETRDGVTRLVLDLTFSADSNAPPGVRTVRAVVRQGAREAPAVLVVRIVPS